MMHHATLSQRRRLYIGGLMLFFLACADTGGGCDGGGGCGDGGCGIGGGAEYPAAGPIVDQSVQVRLPRAGLDWIQENAEPLIAGFLGGGDTIKVCIPADTEQNLCNPAFNPPHTNGYYCSPDAVGYSGNGVDDAPGCELDLALQNISIQPTSNHPDFPGETVLSVAVEIDMDNWVQVPGLTGGGGCSGLRIIGDDTPVAVDIVFNIEHATDRVWIEFGGISTAGLADTVTILAPASNDPHFDAGADA
ncbi:MAG: hypothetical protein KC561_16995, partial [Myxococcales bacterium]|nr:hypothetical protein [Myxococcales bacterium]